MQVKWTLLVLAWSSLPWLLLVHAIAARAMPGPSGQKAALVAILLGNLPYVGAAIWFLQPMQFSLLAQLLVFLLVVYQGFGYAYFHFYNMSETARRIRLLVLIYQGRLSSTEDASESYKPQEMVANRLVRLVELGQLVQDESGRYHIQGGLLLFAARLIAAYRRLLGLDGGLNPREEA